MAVSTRSSSTSSTPRIERAIWAAMVTNPWPTSAVANLSVATGPFGPLTSRHRAVEWSSKPSEYIMFLIATPHPTPRTTWPGSAVRPAPPGNRIGSMPSDASVADNGSGSARAAVSRMQRATGATLSTTCPVMSRSPVVIALRRRISTGSSPHASASRSIWPSWAKHACTTPNPRIAPHGRWLVRAT